MDLTLPIALPAARRLPWRAVAVALACGVLLLGGWLWLRDSSLVAVQKVRIGGLRGAQSAQIEELLRDTAKRMTTMDFSVGALRAAVSGFPVVEDVRASTSFPHGAQIEVVERLPVAILSAAGQRTAVAADGTALGAQLAYGSLPALSGSFLPVPGQRVADPNVRAQLAVLGAAPLLLRRHVERVFSGTEGLTVQMRNGLLVYFGDASRPHAKWLSLARVLSDPGSAGARYVDVRVPERPAAGLPSGAVQLSSAASSPTAALAQRLEQAYGGGSSTASPGTASESEPSTAGGEAPAAGGEALAAGGQPSATGETQSAGESAAAGGGPAGSGTAGAGAAGPPGAVSGSAAAGQAPQAGASAGAAAGAAGGVSATGGAPAKG